MCLLFFRCAKKAPSRHDSLQNDACLSKTKRIFSASETERKSLRPLQTLKPSKTNSITWSLSSSVRQDEEMNIETQGSAVKGPFGVEFKKHTTSKDISSDVQSTSFLPTSNNLGRGAYSEGKTEDTSIHPAKTMKGPKLDSVKFNSKKSHAFKYSIPSSDQSETRSKYDANDDILSDNQHKMEEPCKWRGNMSTRHLDIINKKQNNCSGILENDKNSINEQYPDRICLPKCNGAITFGLKSNIMQSSDLNKVTPATSTKDNVEHTMETCEQGDMNNMANAAKPNILNAGHHTMNGNDGTHLNKLIAEKTISEGQRFSYHDWMDGTKHQLKKMEDSVKENASQPSDNSSLFNYNNGERRFTDRLYSSTVDSGQSTGNVVRQQGSVEVLWTASSGVRYPTPVRLSHNGSTKMVMPTDLASIAESLKQSVSPDAYHKYARRSNSAYMTPLVSIASGRKNTDCLSLLKTKSASVLKLSNNSMIVQNGTTENAAADDVDCNVIKQTQIMKNKPKKTKTAANCTTKRESKCSYSDRKPSHKSLNTHKPMNGRKAKIEKTGSEKRNSSATSSNKRAAKDNKLKKTNSVKDEQKIFRTGVKTREFTLFSSLTHTPSGDSGTVPVRAAGEDIGSICQHWKSFKQNRELEMSSRIPAIQNGPRNDRLPLPPISGLQSSNDHVKNNMSYDDDSESSAMVDTQNHSGVLSRTSISRDPETYCISYTSRETNTPRGTQFPQIPYLDAGAKDMATGKYSKTKSKKASAARAKAKTVKSPDKGGRHRADDTQKPRRGMKTSPRPSHLAPLMKTGQHVATENCSKDDIDLDNTFEDDSIPIPKSLNARKVTFSDVVEYIESDPDDCMNCDQSMPTKSILKNSLSPCLTHAMPMRVEFRLRKMSPRHDSHPEPILLTDIKQVRIPMASIPSQQYSNVYSSLRRGNDLLEVTGTKVTPQNGTQPLSPSWFNCHWRSPEPFCPDLENNDNCTVVLETGKVDEPANDNENGT